ncbi:MAG: extracellular solute-binding protein [Actinomycetota bacterium]|nr:extracellular solute-binding protein [Actinomycetota bacterium]
MSAARRSSANRIFASTVATVAVFTLGLGACGSSSSGAPQASGPVNVAYAGSLQSLFTKTLAPAFDKATGATFSGYPAGSTALASAIKGKTRAEDVFVSASPSANGTLMGPANGDWVSWYASLATAPLVLGYNPSSRFAAALKSKPWYQVVTEPGFLLGRTDPKLDPKGKLSTQALDQAASSKSEPSLGSLATSTTGVFPEEALVGRLQSGQLDAGFFYANEARAASIPSVSLAPVNLSAKYTATVLNRATDEKAAEAFVAYLYSPAGKKILSDAGLTLAATPKVTGVRSAVPASLRKVLGTTG